MKMYLLTTGDGSDGNEWNVEGIYSTRELANKAKTYYERDRTNAFGEIYHHEASIEKWNVDKMPD